MTVKIYLRSILKDKKNCLALFDTNRNGDINNLETVVPSGSKVIWELDYLSGIKIITKIWSKEKNSQIFKSDPRKGWLNKGFEIQLPEFKEERREEYNIEYILCDGTKMNIDPYIRVLPPPPNG